MVSNASEDLPEPETPVTTVNVLCRTSKSMFLRLCTRAPRTTMLSVDMLFVNMDREAVARPISPAGTHSGASARTAESFYYTAAKNPQLEDDSRTKCLCCTIARLRSDRQEEKTI